MLGSLISISCMTLKWLSFYNIYVASSWLDETALIVLNLLLAFSLTSSKMPSFKLRVINSSTHQYWHIFLMTFDKQNLGISTSKEK